MKKIISLILCVLSILSLFAGCSKNKQVTTPSPTRVVRHSKYDPKIYKGIFITTRDISAEESVESDENKTISIPKNTECPFESISINEDKTETIKFLYQDNTYEIKNNFEDPCVSYLPKMYACKASQDIVFYLNTNNNENKSIIKEDDIFFCENFSGEYIKIITARDSVGWIKTDTPIEHNLMFNVVSTGSKPRSLMSAFSYYTLQFGLSPLSREMSRSRTRRNSLVGQYGENIINTEN